MNLSSFTRLLTLVMILVAPASHAVEPECLFLNANATLYGNRAFTNVVWGSGYPTVSAQFSTSTNVVFSPADGGGQKQRMANNTLTPGLTESDNPDFISVYTNNLRLNALIADTGTVSLTYAFSSAMTLVDLMLTDVDDDDVLTIALSGPGGTIAPSNLVFVDEGDLSLTINAGGRPPLELATPPAWNPTTGQLAAQVPWNENRSYTVLRVPEGIAVSNIVLTLSGTNPDTDGPSGPALGSHVYVTLWATPRPLLLAQPETAGTNFQFTIPSLPGRVYRVRAGTEPTAWSTLQTVTGAAAPVVTTLISEPAANFTTRVFAVELVQ